MNHPTNKFTLKTSLLLIVLAFTFSLEAQDLKQDEFGSWTVLYGTHKLANQFDAVTEIRLHDYGIFEDLDNRFIRTGLTYRLGATSFTAGYIHQYSETLSDISVSENRPYEEITLKHSIKKLNISHRYRIEHRWINKQGSTNLFHRFRYRVQITHPLSETFYFKFFDEVFVNLQDPLFNQNRLHFGLGYAFSANFKVEIGYLKNHFLTTNYDRLRLCIVLNSDLRKKSNAQ